MSATIIVPTYNEAPNIAELVRRLNVALADRDAEILFVDDSSDDTPAQITRSAAWSTLPVRMIHREHPDGGLSGAVVAGIHASDREWCVVMDGDLQHPPESVPTLLETAAGTDADVVVASRHVAGGSSAGLSSGLRRFVSTGSITLTHAMFPARLRDCTDPMTGFFVFRRSRVDVASLRPHGFKILLEILARQRLRVVEEPLVFRDRHAGTSKANMKQGIQFLRQLATLRFGRMSRFALIGAIGAAANLAIMALLIVAGMDYLTAAVISAVVTILSNFAMQEAFVFRDLRHNSAAFWQRMCASVGFNSLEAALRLPVLYLIVESTPIPSVLAQAITILAAFVIRFTFMSQVVYRPRPQLPGGGGRSASTAFPPAPTRYLTGKPEGA